MKFVIAFQTCERLSFFKKAVETLLEYNQFVKDYVWVIADDASTDGKTKNYIKSLPFVDYVIFNESRLGISGTLKKIVDIAANKGDAILYIQSDWFCSRSIDFEAVSKFFKMNPKVGSIKCIRYKGRYNVKERFAGTNSYITNKLVEEYETIKINDEKFTKGTWPWADTPGFIRSEAADVLFKGYVLNKKISRPETVRGRNFAEDGWQCCVLENQAFWNLDFDRARPVRTPGRMK